MASTRQSLVSRATAAARKAVGRKSDAGETAATKAPAKKAAAKKAAAKRATPAKKTAATKATPAKKTAAKKATPAKKTAAKKTAPTKKSASAKKSAETLATPAKKAATKKATPVKKAAATKKVAASATRTATTEVKKAASVTKKSATKTATKKSASSKPATLVVLEQEDPWTKDELAEVRGVLNDDITRLTSELAEFEDDLADLIASSDGAGQDQADVGSASYERDQEMQIVFNARDMLQQSEHALERIADRSYGVCENCGNAIGKNRLMAFPRATLCMECKQREERR